MSSRSRRSNFFPTSRVLYHPPVWKPAADGSTMVTKLPPRLLGSMVQEISYQMKLTTTSRKFTISLWVVGKGMREAPDRACWVVGRWHREQTPGGRSISYFWTSLASNNAANGRALCAYPTLPCTMLSAGPAQKPGRRRRYRTRSPSNHPRVGRWMSKPVRSPWWERNRRNFASPPPR